MKFPISYGNQKLPSTTAIFNICPASMCPSRALGLCQLDKVAGCSSAKCYAMNAEKRYGAPHTLPYRMRQMEVWDGATSCVHIVSRFLEEFARKRQKISALRMNEAGDFRHQADVDKASFLACSLEANTGIRTYCYTARKDLDFSGRSSSLVINGSGWMADNQYTVIPKGTWKQFKQENPKAKRCAGDCRKCSLCLHARGNIIVNEVH